MIRQIDSVVETVGQNSISLIDEFISFPREDEVNPAWLVILVAKGREGVLIAIPLLLRNPNANIFHDRFWGCHGFVSTVIG